MVALRAPPSTHARARSLLFFFQAEDGIRDLYVTGVQTCALPICSYVQNAVAARNRKLDDIIVASFFADAKTGEQGATTTSFDSNNVISVDTGGSARSEERRVGKECGLRGVRADERIRRQQRAPAA